MQCLSIFPVLLCVFANVAYLVFYGTKSALLVSTIVMPFSHNIVISLCCYIVNHFIPVITILRYDCKFALSIIVKKLSVVGTCKP